MKTTKITLLLVAMFVTAMAAGIAMGWSTAKPAKLQPKPIGASPLSEELQLTPQQCEQIRPLWEQARDTARECAREGEQIQREHEQALKLLLTDEQKLGYEKLSQENHRRIAEQDAGRKKAFRQAVDGTKRLLQPDQQRAYEQIIKNQLGSISELGERDL